MRRRSSFRRKDRPQGADTDESRRGRSVSAPRAETRVDASGRGQEAVGIGRGTDDLAAESPQQMGSAGRSLPQSSRNPRSSKGVPAGGSGSSSGGSARGNWRFTAASSRRISTPAST